MKVVGQFQKVMDLVTLNNMKIKTKVVVSIIAVTIIIANMPPVTYFLQEDYHYQNKDATFEFTETSNFRDVNVGKKQFESYILKNPNNPNKTLYRTFTLKLWRFWEWWQMLSHYERWLLPFLDTRTQ